MKVYLIFLTFLSSQLAFTTQSVERVSKNCPIKFLSHSDTNKNVLTKSHPLLGTKAENFKLIDTNKNAHYLNEFRQKLVVFDFWFTGCGNCIALNPKLENVIDQFKKNPKVVFVSVCMDKDVGMWKESIKTHWYTAWEGQQQLLTNGLGFQDPMLLALGIRSAPTLKLLGPDGKWLADPVDCRLDNGKDLTEKINEYLQGIKPPY